MKKSKKNRLLKRNQEFNKHLKTAYDYFNNLYPGWENGKKNDVDHIKKRLRQVAKKWQNNPKKKKTKVLYKKDFQEWPFISESIILIQTSKIWISCIIDFQEYALNGLAANALKLKFPHDCGKAIKGKSVSKFIEIGRNL